MGTTILLSALLVLLPPAQDPPGALLQRLAASDDTGARRQIAADPAAAAHALDTLIARIDASVHSDRQRPEQRRVSFDADSLALGVRLGGVYGDVTDNRSYYRRFRAREQRLAGTTLLNERRYRDALTPLTSALTEARTLEDRWLELITRINLAYAHLELGQGRQALAECETAAELSSTLDDRSRALALFNLGSAYLHLGEAAASLRHTQEALRLSQQVGIRLWQGNALLNIGAAHQQLGDLASAGRAFEQALGVFEGTGDRLGIGRSLYNQGLVAFGRRDAAATTALLERALPHIRSVDIRHSHEIELDPEHYQNPIEMSALQILVVAYERLGESEKAAARMAALKALREKSRTAPHVHRAPDR